MNPQSDETLNQLPSQETVALPAQEGQDKEVPDGWKPFPVRVMERALAQLDREGYRKRNRDTGPA